MEIYKNGHAIKVIGKNGDILENPDLTKGYLRPDRLFVAHHEAKLAVECKWHHETTAVYPNGGKDVIRVVDRPAQPYQKAWDEYENVLRYVAYTPEELALRAEQRDKEKKELERILTLEEQYASMERAYKEGVQNA